MIDSLFYTSPDSAPPKAVTTIKLHRHRRATAAAVEGPVNIIQKNGTAPFGVSSTHSAAVICCCNGWSVLQPGLRIKKQLDDHTEHCSRLQAGSQRGRESVVRQGIMG